MSNETVLSSVKGFSASVDDLHENMQGTGNWVAKPDPEVAALRRELSEMREFVEMLRPYFKKGQEGGIVFHGTTTCG